MSEVPLHTRIVFERPYGVPVGKPGVLYLGGRKICVHDSRVLEYKTRNTRKSGAPLILQTGDLASPTGVPRP